MATIRGTHHFSWSVENLGITGSGIGTIKPQSMSFTSTAKQVDVLNGAGDTIGKIFHDFSNTITAEVVIVSTTIAGIVASNIIPEPGTIVEVSDSGDTEASGTTAATTAYVLLEATKQRSNADVCKATFEMQRWTANNVAQTVS